MTGVESKAKSPCPQSSPQSDLLGAWLTCPRLYSRVPASGEGLMWGRGSVSLGKSGVWSGRGPPLSSFSYSLWGNQKEKYQRPALPLLRIGIKNKPQNGSRKHECAVDSPPQQR